ncbi:nuclear pore complex protein NUP58-like isoform X1 [Selaginella moellendorffii]|uniref:nuclear pore complex protein NUP58-like isoform X1 n=1 Tax=Selaginella moellendorffii TaxID=88036 RepID=UPI000D1CA5FC|nr:nuclear pore complex protein NUP58-like isoform X1 [Selaginella moellendorffii]|eukprot:XP_024532592.1 nuclear pore complex protein NUP58-like isoform X1 [Selaginella moellendorffii]
MAAGSSPLFSFQPSSPSPFAASSTPSPFAPPAASSSPFASAPSPFASTPPASSPFSVSSSPFGTSSLFQPQQTQPQQQQQQQVLPQSGQLGLVTNDRTPVTYSTRWADIHPDSQRALLKIEEKILEYRDESWRLDQCERLYDTAALNKGFELDATRISQELSGVAIGIEREQSSLQELMKSVKDMLRNTEVAVRSFMMLCLRFPRPSGGAPGGGTGATPPTSFAAQAPGAVYVSDFYIGVPVKPSPFLQQAVAKFEGRLGEYRQWVEELERLLLRNDKDDRAVSDVSLLQSLPAVMSNLHDFFIYVAAEVESLHEFLETIRLTFLANQRRRGDDNDPFLEADMRENAKREAAAKRVHPSALKPSELAAYAPSAPPLPAAGSSAAFTPTPGGFTPASSSSPFPSILGSASTQGFNSTSSVSGLTLQIPSLFPPSAPSIGTTPSIFGVPGTTGLFGSGVAPSSTTAKPKSRTSRSRR